MLNGTVVEKIDVTSELFLLKVLPDKGVPDFEPGQYVALGLPGSAPRKAGAGSDKSELNPDKLLKRAYSIGSSPHEKGYIEFYIAIVPEGVLTPRLAALQKDDRLFIAPKITGTFTLKHCRDDANLVFVATGTGLAPFVSMLRTPQSWESGRRFTLVHGVRYLKDLAYRDELLALEEQMPERFSYYAAVSREEVPEGIYRGRLVPLFSEKVVRVDVGADQVMLCGNPAMIEEMEVLLSKEGYTPYSRKNPEGNLHYEKYW